MDQEQMYTLEEARKIIEKERKTKKYKLEEAQREIDYISSNIIGWHRLRIPLCLSGDQKQLGGTVVPEDKKNRYGGF